MKDSPAISIIIPVYNAYASIGKCLTSILNQSFADFEVLCVDDCSTDTSAGIIDSFATSDSRCVLIRAAEKLGAGGARNMGIAQARGVYLCFVDADDTLPEDSLLQRFEAIESYGSDVVYGSAQYIFEKEEERIAKKSHTVMSNISIMSNIAFIRQLSYGHWVCIFRKEFVKTHGCAYGRGVLAEDMSFLLSVLFADPRITIIPHAVYTYFRYASSTYHEKKNKEKIESLFFPYSLAFALADTEAKQRLARYFVQDRFRLFRDLSFLLDLDYNARRHMYEILSTLIVDNALFALGNQQETAGCEVRLSLLKRLFVRCIVQKKHRYSNILLYAITYIHAAATCYRSWMRVFAANVSLLRKFFATVKGHFLDMLPATRPHFFLPTPAPAEGTTRGRVLLVEGENWHAEVLPGYCKYFLDLGYACDVLVTGKNFSRQPFARMHDVRVALYTCTLAGMRKILTPDTVARYARVLFTTRILSKKGKGRTKIHVLDYFRRTQAMETTFLTVEHHGEYLETLFPVRGNEKVISPSMLPAGNTDVVPVNPHFFGTIRSTEKNTVTSFMTAGHFDQKRKNFALLFAAIDALHHAGVYNFEVIVVSQDPFPESVSSATRRAIRFYEDTDLDTMSGLLERADFFLPLLDPGIAEHDRYLTKGTSGSFQLIYGFHKPCVVQSAFAAQYSLTADNSIIYDGATGFTEALLRAIAMDREQYRAMQENLRGVAEKIYETSLANLTTLV